MNSNLAYQDEFREELINGEVVAMAPPTMNHCIISSNIYHIFKSYLKGKKCVPFDDGAALYLTEKDHFIPDGMVVCDRDKIKKNWGAGAPDLVIEVLSTSTAKNDRWDKRQAYEQAGVAEYWIVDPVGKSIEVHLLVNSQYVMDNIYFFQPAEVEGTETEVTVTAFKCHLFDDLTINLDDIFGDLF